jgi:hypothetical protein
MINNIKELIKTRGENENISSKLDQEVLMNYKFRLNNLEEENTKLIEEFNSIKRNFEALCFKNKEDLNMIKKLETENAFLKNKIKSLELNLSSARINEDADIIKTYKEKIESLNSLVKNLENRNSNSSSKMQEKEMFYKNYISKLEEKNKIFASNQELLDKENQKMKKEIKRLEEKLEESNLVQQEEKLNKDQLAQLEKASLETQEKTKKEKDLIEKLLFETRDKLKALENQIGELKIESKTKDNLISKFEKEVYRLENEKEMLKNNLKQKMHMIEEIEILENDIKEKKKIIVENEITILKYINEINSMKIEIESLMNKEKEYSDTIYGLQISLQKNSNRNELLSKLEIENISKHFENIVESGLEISEREFTKNVSLIQIKLADQNEKIEKIKRMAQISVDYFQSKSKTNKIESDTLKETTSIKSLEEEIKKIKYDLDTAHFTIHENERKFKSLVDTLEKKLEKKRNKIYSLRNENERMISELKDLKQISVKIEKVDKYSNTEDLDEEKKNLKSQLSSLAAKIKLSVETLTIVLSCRSCNEQTGQINKNLEVLECGHSICKNCVERNFSCYECGLKIKSVAQNLKLNDIILRINFLFQLNGEVEDVVNFINRN